MSAVSVVLGKSTKATFYHKGKRIGVNTAFGLYQKNVRFHINQFGAWPCPDAMTWNPEAKRCVNTTDQVADRIRNAQAAIIQKKVRHWIKAPTKKDIRQLLQIYKTQSSTRPVPYETSGWVDAFFLLHVLRINNNDCHINKNGAWWKLDITRSETIRDLHPVTKDVIVKEYTRCKTKGKILIIPLSRLALGEGSRHLNMLIFNYHRKELERFEPHGAYDDTDPRKKISYELDRDILRNLARQLGLKYVSSRHIFSNAQGKKGFQWYERLAKREQYTTADNFVIKDPVGFCAAWSYFYADMRLKYPHLSSTELTDAVYEVIGTNPDELHQFIRGQMLFLEAEVNKVNKKYPFVKFLNLERGSEEYKDAAATYYSYIVDQFTKLA